MQGDSLRFRLSNLDRLEGRYRLVTVDVAKLNRAWRHPNTNYIDHDGSGATTEKMAFWKRWLDERPDRSMEAPTVHLSDSNRISFYDGRHRFAVLRDRGYRVIKVAVDRRQTNSMRRLFAPARFVVDHKKRSPNRIKDHSAKRC